MVMIFLRGRQCLLFRGMILCQLYFQDVLECLDEKNLEFIYYQRKLCFLHNMLLSDNDVITCIMSVCMYTL